MESKIFLNDIEVEIINEFEYEGKMWVTIVPVNFRGIEREVEKSRLVYR